MEIRADGVGKKLIFQSRYSLRISEANATVAYVENNSTLLGLPHKRFYRVVAYIYYRLAASQLAKGVGENISRAQVVKEQFPDRQRRSVTTEIDHHGYLRCFASLYRVVDRGPFRTVVVSYFKSY